MKVEENKKYNKTMKKKKMTVDEAINIIDEMYQDRMKQIEENNTIYVDRIEKVEFTNLEFASVVLLREVQSLKRKLENSIPEKKIEEVKKKIEKAMNLADECIEESIAIADSDSLNFGKKQAHNCDIELLREVLEGNK